MQNAECRVQNEDLRWISTEERVLMAKGSEASDG